MNRAKDLIERVTSGADPFKVVNEVATIVAEKNFRKTMQNWETHVDKISNYVDDGKWVVDFFSKELTSLLRQVEKIKGIVSTKLEKGKITPNELQNLLFDVDELTNNLDRSSVNQHKHIIKNIVDISAKVFGMKKATQDLKDALEDTLTKVDFV